MSYSYEDPRYTNLSQWKIGNELWEVAGVLSEAEDDSGCNARTEALGVRRLQSDGKANPSPVIRVTRQELEASISSGKRRFSDNKAWNLKS